MGIRNKLWICPMQYTITESDLGHFCVITIDGGVGNSDILELHRDIIEAIAHYHHDAFLIDIRTLLGRPELLSVMHGAGKLPPGSWEQVRKMAVLDNVGHRIDAIIAETVMNVRGLHVRFFFDETMALEWLMAG